MKSSGLNVSYHYIPTKYNTADFCTKPAGLTELVASPFHAGPTFLLDDPNVWPAWIAPEIDPTYAQGTPTSSRITQVGATLTTSATTPPKPPFGLDITRFTPPGPTTLRRLLGATAYLENLLQGRKTPEIPNQLARDQALVHWVRYAQRLKYPAVHAAFDEAARNHKVRFPKLVHQLALFRGPDGLLRVGGRMADGPFEHDNRFPMLLPPWPDHLTALLVNSAHWDLLHTSHNTVHNHIRTRFWIPKGRQSVRKAVACIPCRLTKGSRLRRPPHGQLPPERLQAGAPAFTSILVDQMGPFAITLDDERTVKRWALVLTCAASRAVHIETLVDYSSAAVMNAFSRFWARRGLTQGIIHLDRSTAFQGAAATLSTRLKTDLEPFARTHRLTFSLAPVRAPWHQGAVERLVGLAKASLKPLLHKRRISDDDFSTLLTQVEAILNSRPLTALTEDPEDARPLTPASLLAPHQILLTPPQDDLLTIPGDQGNALRAAVRRQEHLVNDFWLRWARDYVTSLRARHLAAGAGKPLPVLKKPTVGALYLLADATPRANWKLARVKEAHPDEQGVVRYVTVRTSSGHESHRPVSDLIPLEVDLKDETPDSSATPEVPASVAARDERARRRRLIKDPMWGSG
jgi:hypothetical protein